MKRYIYGLICPISKDVKYVGITNNKSKYKLPDNDYYNKWLNQLYLFRNEPQFEILEIIDKSEITIKLEYWKVKFNICYN